MKRRSGTIATAVLFVVMLAGCFGPDGPKIADVSVTPSHGSATLRFTLADPADRVWVEVAGPHATAEPVPVSHEKGPKTVVLPFLDGGSTYVFRVAAERGKAFSRVPGSFETLPDPYAWATGSQTKIAPGALIDAGPCTLGFVLRGADNETLYAATAGHCARTLGMNVSVVSREEGNRTYRVGTVVAVEAHPEGGPDWALIRIDAGSRAWVSPEVPGLGGPTGRAKATEWTGGDRVCLVGQGLAITTGGPRTRCGTIGKTTNTTFRQAPFTEVTYDVDVRSGDSGAPVLDDDGRAVAIHVALNPVVHGIGLTVESLEARVLDKQGPNVRVARSAG